MVSPLSFMGLTYAVPQPSSTSSAMINDLGPSVLHLGDSSEEEPLATRRPHKKRKRNHQRDPTPTAISAATSYQPP